MNPVIELRPLHLPEKLSRAGESVSVALALIKNESDIISLWLSHVCALFDCVYIADHQSIDGTREFLLDAAKSDRKIHLYSFDQPGYFQSEITNHLAQLAAEENPNSWIFPLDADEFLNVADRNEFHILLKKQKPGNILVLNWRNCIPYHLHGDFMLEAGLTCIFPFQPGMYKKVAVNSSFLKNHNIRFVQGNHDVETNSGKSLKTNYNSFVDVLHLPIRSVEHFALKCAQGFVAYSQLPPERKSTGQGTHWTNMIDSILMSGRFDADVIRKFIVSYGLPNDLRPVSVYTLVDMGWTVGKFSVPVKDMSHIPITRKTTFMELSWQVLEQNSQHEKLQGFLKIIDNNRQIILDMSSWQKEGRISVVFEKLDGQPDDVPNEISAFLNEIDLLDNFLSMALIRRETPVPSTWEGHIPFLYCLLIFSKPRRFVELGSQYGNCFFAACQISKLIGNSIECIAIDSWAGDEHTGRYYNDVFDKFLSVMRQNYPNGRYIREFFNNALPKFEDGSIDLLHIDGLHTYDAVAEDFENWRPKLSDRGIIMFHDTKVRERDFGVWRLWADLEKKYPSIEFEHGHGLGVILVGDNPTFNVMRLFEMFAKPEYARMVKSFFSRVGGISPIR